MLEIILVVLLLTVLITAGSVLMSINSTELIGVGLVLYVVGLSIVTLSVIVFYNTEKALALELYNQSKPITKYQSRLILSSDEYTHDNPIILKKDK